jgi:hypothetical protein
MVPWFGPGLDCGRFVSLVYKYIYICMFVGSKMKFIVGFSLFLFTCRWIAVGSVSFSKCDGIYIEKHCV